MSQEKSTEQPGTNAPGTRIPTADAPIATTPRTAEDWNALWMAKQSEHCIARDADYWNERALTFTNKDNPGSYTERFLQLADVREGESVFDMGCGTGNLSIPLGRAGHEVLAADFSHVMLERLESAARDAGTSTISTMQLSWDDDWAARGIHENGFDVCMASRSINTNDLQDSLRNLTSVARRRCCVTLPAGPSPHIDGRMLKEIGMPPAPSFDSIYALAILQGEGFDPELTYIDTLREDVFESFEAALAKHVKMACFALEVAARRDTTANEATSNAATGITANSISEDELGKRVESWLEQNLVTSTDDRGKEVLTLSNPRHVSWAFVSWNVS